MTKDVGKHISCVRGCACTSGLLLGTGEGVVSWECVGILADGKTSLYSPPILGLQVSTGEREMTLVVPFVRLRSSLQSTLLLSQYLEAHRRFVFKLFGD